MLRDTWSHLVRKTEQWCSYIEYEQPLYNFCISNYMQQTNVPFDSTIGHSNAFWDSHLSLDMKITDATAHFLTNEFISTENEDQINSWYLKKKITTKNRRWRCELMKSNDQSLGSGGRKWKKKHMKMNLVHLLSNFLYHPDHLCLSFARSLTNLRLQFSFTRLYTNEAHWQVTKQMENKQNNMRTQWHLICCVFFSSQIESFILLRLAILDLD